MSDEDIEKIENEQEKKSSNIEDALDEKTRKGWLFSVVFLSIVILIILFLSFFPINSDNRDIIVGMLGTITGSIGAMIAIASGRDPAEVEELKEKLAAANADRQALISRLRDAQIQMQILRDQINDLQTAMIKELSIFSGKKIISEPHDTKLNKDVEKWLPDDNKNNKKKNK